MSLSQLGETVGKVETLVKDCAYIADPSQAFYSLCIQPNADDKPSNSLLLESAEIDSKHNLKSLLLIDAALKLVCQGQTVEVSALSDNGQPLLSLFAEHDLCADTEWLSPSKLKIHFKMADPTLDEDSRLKAPAVMDSLRLLIKQIDSIRDIDNSLFLGGVFAYDLLATFENLPAVKQSANSCPDFVFYLAETMLVIDHQQQQSQLLGNIFSGEQVAQQYFAISQRLESLSQSIEQLQALSPATTFDKHEVKVDLDDPAYCAHVLALKEHVLAGDIFQVVPSRSFSLACPSPLHAYRELKKQNPSPYMFYMQDSDFAIFGASPESALKYTRQTNQVEVYPIAGTRPRGKHSDGSTDYDLDSRLELSLQLDEKERAEHLMLVDLARNDIAKVSQAGSRHVKDLLKVDRYSHVMHLVSRVVGQLRQDLDALHAYQACMNMGTLVGAPKVSAATLIRKVEQQRRGSYGGAVGYINGQGDMDTCIVIRSAFVKNGVAQVQAGAGVVYDSDPQSEANETRNKAQAVINAILTAHQGEQA
jgi:anthranilate synthase component 1